MLLNKHELKEIVDALRDGNLTLQLNDKLPLKDYNAIVRQIQKAMQEY
jgi:hypothetical protein